MWSGRKACSWRAVGRLRDDGRSRARKMVGRSGSEVVMMSFFATPLRRGEGPPSPKGGGGPRRNLEKRLGVSGDVGSLEQGE